MSFVADEDVSQRLAEIRRDEGRHWPCADDAHEWAYSPERGASVCCHCGCLYWSTPPQPDHG